MVESGQSEEQVYQISERFWFIHPKKCMYDPLLKNGHRIFLKLDLKLVDDSGKIVARPGLAKFGSFEEVVELPKIVEKYTFLVCTFNK